MSHPIDTQFDARHIWHPYTSMSEPLPCFPVVSAEGCRLKLEDGRELIDGMSSWWAALHGYNHPRLNEAVRNQLKSFSHVMFGGITHQPAVDLAKKLIEITPDRLECLFFADSGSVAVEVAMKMALQYWHARGEKRHKFLSLTHAYHGDTFGAMSVCDPKNSMHSLYEGYLPEHLFAPLFTIGFDDEWDEKATDELDQLFEKEHKKIGAVIVEPIVQGAGGMRMYHPNYLKYLRKQCDHYGILLIADEIATGFGRTGELFACDHADIQPDIMTLGKALTGGYITLSATLTTRHVADTISNGEAKCFMHGPTFMGNPLACAVAIESLTLLQESDWRSNVATIEEQLREALLPLNGAPFVKEARVLGAIGVVELTHPILQDRVQQFLVDEGVWIRPFGRLIYIMPPFIISKEELNQLTSALIKLIEQPDFNEYLQLN